MKGDTAAFPRQNRKMVGITLTPPKIRLRKIASENQRLLVKSATALAERTHGGQTHNSSRYIDLDPGNFQSKRSCVRRCELAKTQSDALIACLHTLKARRIIFYSYMHEQRIRDYCPVQRVPAHHYPFLSVDPVSAGVQSWIRRCCRYPA